MHLRRLFNGGVGALGVKQQNVNSIWLNDSKCLKPFDVMVYPFQAMNSNVAGQTQQT